MGGRLKKLRTDRTWTLKYVASRVGTTKANLSKIENKPKTRINLDVFFKLCDLYEVDARTVVTGKSTNTEDVPPNMRSLINDYGAIDNELKGPVRVLISKLADLANGKPTPRKTAGKKTKPRTVLPV